MFKIDTNILNIDKVICQNIDKFDASERGLLSQNLLGQMRNFVEHILLKEHANGVDIENTYENIQLAIETGKTKGQLTFLRNFHRFLQSVASHYTLDPENSERLMLKYYEYLLRIKSRLKTVHGLDVLLNIDQFPIHTDPAMQEYYEKIVEKIEHPMKARKASSYKDRYYIQKIKPFFVNQEIYYEVTFTVANAKVSKFDRVIAFTKIDISGNYAVKLSVIHDAIEVLEKSMPIQIISKWEVSIRPCELNNFSQILGFNIDMQSDSVEYKNLMKYLTASTVSLTELVRMPEEYFNLVVSEVASGARSIYFLDALKKCQFLTQRSAQGSNVLNYLLLRLNNKIIKLQRSQESCNLLSGLNLNVKCVPFDRMPFYASLCGHNPKIADIFFAIDSTNREPELFARLIKNNTENKRQLYTDIRGLEQTEEEVEHLMTTYNRSLYLPLHQNRLLEKFNRHIYIKGYEQDTLDIIKRLKSLSLAGISNYTNSVDSWLKQSAYEIDSGDKKEILRRLFADSGVALIYGAAGTGKTTSIQHISHFFNENRKLFLANTNPAVENLRRKVTAANCKFQTIAKFLAPRSIDTEFDLLVIDECSTVSNKDMVDVLRKAKFKYLVLVGDVYQIEAIIFGNWFDVARDFMPNAAMFELTTPYRTSNENLIELWRRVRSLEDNILEHIARNEYSARLNDSIFRELSDDEILLCLNYDGLYGINNLNKFLQSNNPSPAVEWGIQTYKIGDPVLFNESDRFVPVIYNNLKGKIVDIVESKHSIQFDIEIDRAVNALHLAGLDLDLVGSAESGNSIIRFQVQEQDDTDKDNEVVESVVPFQVAYAISIHKAQGLEYNSVRVVITNEIEEMVSHSIFYTAITRAKEHLTIYWTPETEKKILNGLKKVDSEKDAKLLTQRIEANLEDRVNTTLP